MTDFMTGLHKRHIWLMTNTIAILEHLLTRVTDEELRTLRDGPDGWTTLEIICHLRDFNDIFFARARMILEQDNPALPGYDHEAMVIERRYNQQDVTAIMADFKEKRAVFADFFRALEPEEWGRAGIHPERGPFTLTNAVMQAGLHDVEHLEQITRVLSQRPV